MAEFGDEADSKVLECTVISVRAGRVKVRVHHDGYRFVLEHTVYFGIKRSIYRLFDTLYGNYN